MNAEKLVKEIKERYNTPQEWCEKEIKEAQQRLFLIDMIDHWTEEDRKSYDEVYNEISELKNCTTWEEVENIVSKYII